MRRVQTSKSTYFSAIVKAAVLFLLLLLMLVGGFQCSKTNDPFNQKQDDDTVSVRLVFDSVPAKKRVLAEQKATPEAAQPKQPPIEPEPQLEPVETDKVEAEQVESEQVESEQIESEQPVEAADEKQDKPALAKAEKKEQTETESAQKTQHQEQAEAKPEPVKKAVQKPNLDELFAKLEEEAPEPTTVSGEMPSAYGDAINKDVKDDGYTKEQEKVIKQYEALIMEKVKANWRRPFSATPEMSVTIKIILFSGGYKRAVEFGEQTEAVNQAYLDSVLDALNKTESFPVPTDPELFDYFREIEFEFTSEDLSL